MINSMTWQVITDNKAEEIYEAEGKEITVLMADSSTSYFTFKSYVIFLTSVFPKRKWFGTYKKLSKYPKFDQ